jgi:hypothetical protein
MTCKTSDSLCDILFTHMSAATTLMNTKQILEHVEGGAEGVGGDAKQEAGSLNVL